MKLSRFVTGILAVALIAFMVSDAAAQGRRGEGGGRGGPGGFGGPGGPGGGPGFGGFGGFGGRGGGDMKLGLLRVDEVQTELEVSPAQKEALDKMFEQSRGERPDFAGVRDMSETERNAFFEKMRKEAEERNKEMTAQLEEVLLPQQMERLDQIALQVRGVQALEDEEVAAKLNITADQKKKLTEVREGLQEKMRERMREMFQAGGGPGGGGGDFREAMGKFREESEKEILAVLNADQQKKFEEMKGEKFEMPEGFGRFGGGPGGPGGPGGFGGRGPGGQGGPGGRGGRGGRPQAE